MTPGQIVVNSRKFDESIRRTWHCELLEADGEALTLLGTFEDDVLHEQLGHIRRGTISREYYWLDRWYNVFEFREPDRSFRNFYCNVTMPPTFANGILDYIDLDVDLLVWPDKSIEVLDFDEFHAHAQLYSYPPSIAETINLSVEELRGMVEREQFPFNRFQVP